jgi:TadE-like protein
MLRNSIRRKKTRRRGAALTELAICLPLLSIVTLGAIEAANGIYVRQKLVSIAYDLARAASAQNADLDTRSTELFRTYGISGGSYSSSPANPLKASNGEPITITVQAPMSRNSIGLNRLYGGVTASASLTMTKG